MIFSNQVILNAFDDFGNGIMTRYVMGIGEAEVFSDRLKRELHAPEAINVHGVLQSEHLVDAELQLARS